MTDREAVTALTEHVYDQARWDAEHSRWFWAKMVEVARQAKAERCKARKGATKK